MADAGKVAILPRGLWSAETVYEPLDLVYYNNNSFVALKESVGVTPVDGDTWMLSVSSIGQETIDAILNGTQQVGDSAKLGGKTAEQWRNTTVKRVDLSNQAQASDYRKTVIALCECGVDSFSQGTISLHRSNGLNSNEIRVDCLLSSRTSGANTINAFISTVQLPISDGRKIKPCVFSYNGKTYGGIELYITDSRCSAVVFYGVGNFEVFGVDYYDTQNMVAINTEIADSLSYEVNTTLPLYINGNKVSTEVDLANYFKNTGGEVSGDVAIVRSGTTDANFIAKNDNGRVLLKMASSGNHGVYSDKHSKWIAYMDANGNGYVNGTASGNLPLSGGVVNGLTAIQNQGNVPFLVANLSDTPSYIAFNGANGLNGLLGFGDANSPMFYESDGQTAHLLLHTGNKPSGSYTGNGDATERTINIGGAGSVIAVWANSRLYFVTPGGTVGGTAPDNTKNSATATFANATLVIKANSSILNESGVTYWWQVL